MSRSRVMCTNAQAAMAHRDNGRRMMATALELFDEGHRLAGEIMRELSRMEYARAVEMLAGSAAA